MRCGTSDEKRDAATGQMTPAFGGPGRLIGGPESYWAALARHLRLGGPHIAPRAALARMSRSGPSNDPVRSDNALDPSLTVREDTSPFQDTNGFAKTGRPEGIGLDQRLDGLRAVRLYDPKAACRRIVGRVHERSRGVNAGGVTL